MTTELASEKIITILHVVWLGYSHMFCSKTSGLYTMTPFLDSTNKIFCLCEQHISTRLNKTELWLKCELSRSIFYQMCSGGRACSCPVLGHANWNILQTSCVYTDLRNKQNGSPEPKPQNNWDQAIILSFKVSTKHWSQKEKQKVTSWHP